MHRLGCERLRGWEDPEALPASQEDVEGVVPVVVHHRPGGVAAQPEVDSLQRKSREELRLGQRALEAVQRPRVGPVPVRRRQQVCLDVEVHPPARLRSPGGQGRAGGGGGVGRGLAEALCEAAALAREAHGTGTEDVGQHRREVAEDAAVVLVLVGKHRPRSAVVVTVTGRPHDLRKDELVASPRCQLHWLESRQGVRQAKCPQPCSCCSLCRHSGRRADVEGPPLKDKARKLVSGGGDPQQGDATRHLGLRTPPSRVLGLEAAAQELVLPLQCQHSLRRCLQTEGQLDGAQEHR
mmetsp:Transcript_27896/g.83402  ORF Transcript_27896/g.83402 Transcript_27896/m.83402 type:complete len:295 (-) Transcript_27896:432-1316(-)